MALSKIQAESMNLADTYAFSGTVSGTSVAGSNAFSAKGNSGAWTTYSTGSFIPFDDDSGHDSFDTDSVYNTSTYKFTAPATGVYMFWWSIYTAQSTSANGFALKRNDAYIQLQKSAYFITYEENHTNDHIQNAMVVIPVTSGQTIGVVSAVPSDVYRPHSSWGGCRLA